MISRLYIFSEIILLEWKMSLFSGLLHTFTYTYSVLLIQCYVICTEWNFFFNVLINYWLHLSHTSYTPSLPQRPQGLVFNRQKHAPVPFRILMLHYSSSPIERGRGNGFTYEGPWWWLAGQPSRPLIPFTVSQGRFQLNTLNVGDILIPLSPRLSLQPHLLRPDGKESVDKKNLSVFVVFLLWHFYCIFFLSIKKHLGFIDRRIYLSCRHI